MHCLCVSVPLWLHFRHRIPLTDMQLRIPSSWAPYLLVSPFLILFAVFGLFPLLFSLWLAFQSWEPTSGIESMKFVGLENFVFALTDDWF